MHTKLKQIVTQIASLIRVDVWKRSYHFGFACFVFVVLVFGVHMTTRAANPPNIITYQGKLLESGVSVTTTKAMKFVIYDASTGGYAVYTASGTLPTTSTIDVTPTAGIFSVDLGDTGTNALSDAVFASGELWLEVTIDGTTLSPRKRLTSVPYAVNAARLGGNFATSTPTTTNYIPVASNDGSFSFNTTTVTNLFADTATVSGTASFLQESVQIFGGKLTDAYLQIGSSTDPGPGGNIIVYGNSSNPGSISLYHNVSRVGNNPEFSVNVSSDPTIGTNLILGGGYGDTNGTFRLRDSDGQTMVLLAATSSVSSYIRNDLQLLGSLTVADTVTSSEIVATGGITLGGVYRTTWPNAIVGADGLFVDGGGYLYPATTTYPVVIGADATSTDALLQVIGDGYVSGDMVIDGNTNFADNNAIIGVFNDYAIATFGNGVDSSGYMLLNGTVTTSAQLWLTRAGVPWGNLSISTTSISQGAATLQLGNGSGVSGAIELFDGIDSNSSTIFLSGSTTVDSYLFGNIYFNVTPEVVANATKDIYLVGPTSSETIFGVPSFAYPQYGVSNFIDDNDAIISAGPLFAPIVAANAFINDDFSIYDSQNINGINFRTMNWRLTLESPDSIALNPNSQAPVLVGTSTTSTLSSILEVEGNSYFDGSNIITGGLSVANNFFTVGASYVGINTTTFLNTFTVDGSGFISETSTARDFVATGGITLGGVYRTTWPTSTGGSSLFVDGGGYLYPVTSTYPVVLGTSTTMTGDIFQVSGNSYVSGTSTASNVVVTGGMTLGGVYRTTWPNDVPGGDAFVDGGGYLYPASSTDQVVIGATATSTDDLLEVRGDTYIQGDLTLREGLIQTPRVAPTVRSTIVDDGSTLLDGARDVVVSGKYAYVAAVRDATVSVIDISDPDNPEIVGSVTDNININGPVEMAVSGHYLYVVNTTGRSLEIIDVSDPTNPVQIGRAIHSFPNDIVIYGPTDVEVSGKYVYVVNTYALEFSGLTIFDVSDPTAPVVIGDIHDGIPEETYQLDGASALAVHGDYAYVGAGSYMSIISISDPRNPTVIGEVTSSSISTPTDIYVSGRYAYLTSQVGGSLSIIDISDPTNPTVVGAALNGGSFALLGASGVQVSGNYAYVIAGAISGSPNNLSTIDISDPSNPTLVSTLTSTTTVPMDGVMGLDIAGTYAYIVAEDDNTFHILDLGGIDTYAANIGTVGSNNISVYENLQVGNDITIDGGLRVRRSTEFQSGITLSGYRSSASPSTVLDAALYIESSTPASITNALYQQSGTLYWNGSALAGATNFFPNYIYVGTTTEYITTSSFVMAGGDDAYIHDLLGVGDSLYVENAIHIGTSSLHLSGDVSGGEIRMTGGPLAIDSLGGLLSINVNSNQQVQIGGGNSRTYIGESGLESYLATTSEAVSLTVAGDGYDSLLEFFSGDMAEGVLFAGSNGVQSGDYAGLIYNTASTNYGSFNQYGLTLFNNRVGDGGNKNIAVVVDSSQVLTITEDSLGINTTTPNYNLAVSGTGRITSDLSVGGNLSVLAGQVNLGGYIGFADTATNTLTFSGSALFTSTLSSTDGDIFAFSATTDFTTTSVFRVADGGGTLLSVDGDGNTDINGTLEINLANPADFGGGTNVALCISEEVTNDVVLIDCPLAPTDLSELYETTSEVEAGDIVMTTDQTVTYEEGLFDPLTGGSVKDSNNNQQKKSTTISVLTRATSQATAVVGVISTNPAQVLGRVVKDVSINPQAVAITGRVPVKVNLENGSIAIGDSIGISDTAGVGRKAMLGDTTVGIALEPYNGGSDNKIMMAIMPGQYGLLQRIETLESYINTTYGTEFGGIDSDMTVSYDEGTNTIAAVSGSLQLNGGSLLSVGSITGFDGKWSISEDGLLVSSIETSQGRKDLYALQSEKSEIVLSGSSILEDGMATIEFEAIYTEIIDPDEPIKITVTLTDEANGIYVSEKSSTGFVVRELSGGTSNATFDWVAIVYRYTGINENPEADSDNEDEDSDSSGDTVENTSSTPETNTTMPEDMDDGDTSDTPSSTPAVEDTTSSTPTDANDNSPPENQDQENGNEQTDSEPTNNEDEPIDDLQPPAEDPEVVVDTPSYPDPEPVGEAPAADPPPSEPDTTPPTEA